ncbi:MAG TPA: mandelate racemase/muconate lactonizing enzyme family protein [Chloroflexota bacterium]|nr:mandelate racemase/muconate lactonizing enzyme family protein [Chloroflexota bacterium]
MRIQSVKTYVVGNPSPIRGGANWVFLKLLTDEGLTGIGKAFWVPFDPRATARLIEDVGERLVIGADPFQIERLWRTLYSSGYAQHPDLTMMAVISAFEMACWDIIGKALNQPIYNLLGGKYHERLRSYTYLYESGSSEADPQTDPDRAAERALAYVEQGFTAVKLDPVGPENIAAVQLSLETLRTAESVVKKVREAVGDRADILVGTHGQMTTSSAIRLAKRLEPYDPLWFEEPVPPENRAELARVARSTSIPIATGERLSTKYEFSELLEQQAASILQMALGRVGGILEAKKIAGMAESHYAQIAPHLWTSPIEGAANIQIDTCSPNFLVQESIETWGGFHADILIEPIRWEKGYIIPPTGPGLGIELNEEVAAKHPYVG